MPSSTSAVLAVYSADSDNDSDDLVSDTCGGGGTMMICDSNTDWWLDNTNFDLMTQHDVSVALLLLASAVRRLLNDTLQAYVVPLYTAAVLAYFAALHARRFQKKQQRRRQLQKREQQEQRAAQRKPVITLAPTSGAALSEQEEAISEEEELDGQLQPIDLTGLYRLVQIENLDAFLAAQGVPWPLRKAASKVMPIHEITHRRNHLQIRIDAGPIQTSTLYQINGGPVETTVRGRLFRDNVRYLRATEDDEESNNSNGGSGNSGRVVGVINEKTAVAEGYRVTVSRQLSACRNYIHMQSVASFPNDPARERIASTQVFERISRP